MEQLFKQGYTVIKNKLQTLVSPTLDEITLLEKDGRFEEPITKTNDNYTKTLRNVMIYANPTLK